LRPPLLALLLALASTAAAEPGRAVTRDGGVLEGDVRVDAAASTAVVGKVTLPLDAVYLVERLDGTLIWARDFEHRMNAYEFLGADAARKVWIAAAKEAVRIGGSPVARDMVDRAEALGFSGPAADDLRRQADKVRGVPGERGRKVRADAEAAGARAHGEVVAARALAAQAEPEAVAQRLLREAIRLAPDHAGVWRRIQEIAPPNHPFGDQRVWLDWQVDLFSSGLELASESETELLRARSTWRRDAFGAIAPPILLVTPVKSSRTVGRCLGYMRLAIRALDSLFLTPNPVSRRPDERLAIYLYADRDEYLAKSGAMSRSGHRERLEWTAGHYSPSEQLSRFYWTDDLDAERRMVGTCVHEITHHWLQERNPRYRSGAMRLALDPPGFWIVEGFATFMEEGTYDLESGTWRLFNPRSESLDTVVSLRRGGRLIPWQTLFLLTQRGFGELSAENDITIVRRWRLGQAKMSQRHAFYSQSAAACHYLYHAENGKHRAALLDYVQSYYTGRLEKLAPIPAFGVDGKALGAAVAKFAREVAAGWRPPA